MLRKTIDDFDNFLALSLSNSRIRDLNTAIVQVTRWEMQHLIANF